MDWNGPEFRAELKAWVETVAGPVVRLEQGKLRPWATVWQVHTEDGMFYAKQNSPGQQFEAALMRLLVELAPSYVVPGPPWTPTAACC